MIFNYTLVERTVIAYIDIVNPLLNAARQHSTVTSRRAKAIAKPLRFLALDLEDRQQLQQIISQQDLVVHCAGPFHHRDGRVLS
ncbi:MAG: NAD-dependent epimerase/dehydratase family protein, partial [Cyanobacteria bacterium J06648_1]